ncbi:hypothetical protein N599_22720 [Saccharopolyspora erythraea D]|nr:hypothetical protein N599_22720 [Saccharopolyspora erythraea D]
MMPVPGLDRTGTPPGFADGAPVLVLLDPYGGVVTLMT